MPRYDDIIARIYALMGMNTAGTGASISASVLGMAVNQGYREIYSAGRWRWLIKEDYTKKLPFTSVSGDSTGTALSVEDTSDMFDGQTLVVSDGLNFETCIISGEIATPLTLGSPGLDGEYETGDTAGGISITKPDDHFKTLDVKIKQGAGPPQSLIHINEERLKSVSGYFSFSRPAYYFERENQLFVYPAPDSVYRILLSYLRVPSAISSGVDPLFNIRWDELLVHYGLAFALQREEKYDLAREHQQMFYRMLEMMKKVEFINYDSYPAFKLADEYRTLPSFKIGG